MYLNLHSHMQKLLPLIIITVIMLIALIIASSELFKNSTRDRARDTGLYVCVAKNRSKRNIAGRQAYIPVL